MKLKDKLAVVSLWAPDVAEAAHFYQDVLGLKLLSQAHNQRPHFQLGETLLVILEGEPQKAKEAKPERFPVIAFETEDIQASVRALNEHQVALPWDVEEDADSKWVMFHDPAGNLIEIAEFK